MPVIDSDTHVLEPDAAWAYLESHELKYTPVQTEGPRTADGSPRGYWLVDGTVRNRPIRAETHFTTAGTRELHDVPARLSQMDELGVDIQIVYPTLLTSCGLRHRDIEYALTRSYNRWMADRCAQSRGRLRWVMLPAFQCMDKAIEELRWAREHGAVGALKKGDAEGGYWPSDPYFFPFYEEAERLDLPMCFHVATGNLAPMPPEQAVYEQFYREILPTVHAMQSIITCKLPEQFPKLRWGFIEATSSWVPFTLYYMRRIVAKAEERGFNRPTQHMYADFDVSLANNNVFVSCLPDEDLPYIISQVGDDNLLTGSDYSHQDSSEELRFKDALQKRVDAGHISPSTLRKITDDNPRRFYGL